MSTDFRATVPLTVGSLFSGIGGLELGLERAGMRVCWQVEIDPFCQRVLAKHWPHVTRHSDVREVGSASLENVDVICGGFPCQDISSAGKRAGIDGERSGLWREFARIIREIRPRFVLMENVSALLARGMGDVLGDLAACGYDAEWDCLPASVFGAPHRRDRIFVLAYPHSAGRDGGARVFDGEPHQSRDGSPWHYTTARGNSGRIRVVPPPGISRMDDGAASRVDRLRAIGNAVCPQVAHWIGQRIVAHAEGRS